MHSQIQREVARLLEQRGGPIADATLNSIVSLILLLAVQGDIRIPRRIVPISLELAGRGRRPLKLKRGFPVRRNFTPLRPAFAPRCNGTACNCAALLLTAPDADEPAATDADDADGAAAVAVAVAVAVALDKDADALPGVVGDADADEDAEKKRGDTP